MGNANANGDDSNDCERGGDNLVADPVDMDDDSDNNEVDDEKGAYYEEYGRIVVHGTNNHLDGVVGDGVESSGGAGTMVNGIIYNN